MGTPDFAVAPLKKLVEGGYNIVGVITMPDKPIGRHQNELSASPVKTSGVNSASVRTTRSKVRGEEKSQGISEERKAS